MKYVDEYRDGAQVRDLVALIERTVTRPWTLMEICGGQTHAILRFGIDQMLPRGLTLIHGPGCPVCVTPVGMIDKAVKLALQPKLILCSFGDMLRVPGTTSSLYTAKAQGADVRFVYSPIDAVDVAAEHPTREVVFFAVGFETTAPANALAVAQAQRRGIKNFSILCSQVLVPPAIEAILSEQDCRVEGLIAPGHVCAVVGYSEYEPIARRYRVPIVVTGFEPVDILGGILGCVRQLETGQSEVENAYARGVTRSGNTNAQRLMQLVFEVTDRTWRGLGRIPQSGLRLRAAYRLYDAEARFGLEAQAEPESTVCMSGAILQGRKRPPDCPNFGTTCTPATPMGAPMVSAEGACAAYFQYRRAGGALNEAKA